MIDAARVFVGPHRRAAMSDIVGCPMDFGARILTTRWAVRAPIPLFRIGLGSLFLGRLLLLEHRGRTSGERRFVVLEVAEREAHDRIVIASGFGRSAQWYRNLEADPRCAVTVGRRRSVPARAELLDPAESRELLVRYSGEHPEAWTALRRAIVDATGDPDPEIPMVRLHLSSTS